MKQKSKKQVLRKKKEFRFHKIEKINDKGAKTKKWHPAYVFLEKGNIYIYVSLTHSNNIDNLILIKLRKNPDPNDERDSYWVVEIKEDTKDRFGKREHGWDIDDLDDKDIRNEYEKR